MYSWGHNRNCCMLSVFEDHVFIYMLHWNIRVFWKVFFSINFSLFERDNTSFWGVFSLFFVFSPSIHNMESDSSIFPLYFSLFSFSHYKLWSGSIFPSLCSHVWSAVVDTELSYSEVLQIHLLYFSPLGQDHTAFNCWGFLRRQAICVPVKVRRSKNVRLASNREELWPEWVEDFPSKGNQGRCKSRERKEEQE